MKTSLALAGTVIMIGAFGCSSRPAQSNLGPFSITNCKMGFTDGSNYSFYESQSAAQAAAKNLTNAWLQANPQWDGYNTTLGPNEPNYDVTEASEFSVTLTATAVVQSFTVAYYNSSGAEISTGTAFLTGGPSELTAGQTARFMDLSAPSGAATCQVIGSDSGNA